MITDPTPDSSVPALLLVVDDSRLDRAIVCRMVEKMGHVARSCNDASEALGQLEKALPDLIVVDVYMPGMTGYELVRHIRSWLHHWIPIIFVSASTDNESLLEGLRAGGDDYLFKPISYEILESKVKTLLGRARTLAQVVEQNAQLLNYRDRMSDEREMALALMQQMSGIESISDPCLQFHLKPSEQFSGDLICAARTPDNKLNVLLADSAGHGLGAALAIVPLTRSFYQMTSRGFEVGAIVREINATIRNYLPLPRYVAAILISYDPLAGHLVIWNGGCPPVYLVDDSGILIQGFRSSSVPFGVLPSEQFEVELSHTVLHAAGLHLLACTDGVSDLWPDEQGGLWGLVRQTVRHCGALKFDCMREQIHARLAEVTLQDDVALLMLQCSVAPSQPGLTEPGQIAGSAPVSFSTTGLREVGLPLERDWELMLTLGAQRLQYLDMVPFLLGLVRQVEQENPHWTVDGNRLFMIFSELFNNALDHGLLRLDSQLKNGGGGLETYFEQRDQRLQELENGHIHIHLSRTHLATPDSPDPNVGEGIDTLHIYFRDSGPGFDFNAWSQGFQHNVLFHGRGLHLVRSLCSKVHFLGNGSEILVQFDFGRPTS